MCVDTSIGFPSLLLHRVNVSQNEKLYCSHDIVGMMRADFDDVLVIIRCLPLTDDFYLPSRDVTDTYTRTYIHTGDSMISNLYVSVGNVKSKKIRRFWQIRTNRDENTRAQLSYYILYTVANKYSFLFRIHQNVF